MVLEISSIVAGDTITQGIQEWDNKCCNCHKQSSFYLSFAYKLDIAITWMYRYTMYLSLLTCNIELLKRSGKQAKQIILNFISLSDRLLLPPQINRNCLPFRCDKSGLNSFLKLKYYFIVVVEILYGPLIIVKLLNVLEIITF